MTSENGYDNARQTILRGIESLALIAEHQGQKHARAGLHVQAEILNTLDRRIEQHQLPGGVVRSIINDARLDVLMTLTDLKVSLTFLKQRCAAPTEKLRAEAEEHLTALGEYVEAALQRGQISEDMELPQILADLHALDTIETSLRGCMLTAG